MMCSRRSAPSWPSRASSPPPCGKFGQCSRASSSVRGTARTAWSRRRAFAWPTIFSHCAPRAEKSPPSSKPRGALPPEGLLDALQAIEARHGRSRSFANAPRTLDLDLLLYGDAVVNQPRLVVPHPRMHLRAFVLRPLVELAAGIAIPGIGAAQAMLEQCGDQSVERISG